MIRTKSTNTAFHCVLTNDKLKLDSDAPIFKGGPGNGFRPHELLEAALASCIRINAASRQSGYVVQPLFYFDLGLKEY
jgi:putative redox protein